MKKIRFDDCICHSNISNHNDIKDELLSLIAEGYSETMDDLSSNDRISKLDFGNSKDRTRPWVNKFLPNWDDSLRECIQSMGYVGVDLYNCWFQQYKEGDTHGWHIHGGHFTGVYYLEFPSNSARTEIYSPYSGSIEKVNIEEGDFILFPAHWIHRAPSNTSDRKTIISWNFNVTQESINFETFVSGKPNT